MIIQNNILGLNSHRNLFKNNSTTAKNFEKLSSGFRINRAGDDPAGLAISEKMRRQIRGLVMAQRNVSAGINLIQTAEGSLNEAHATLNRMRELAVQASNGVYQDFDRAQLEKEFEALKSEINSMAESTNYNNVKLLDGSKSYNSRSNTTGFSANARAVETQHNLEGSNLAEVQTTPDRVDPNNLTSVPGLTGVNMVAFSNTLANTIIPQAIDAIMNTFTCLEWFRNSRIEMGLQYLPSSSMFGAQASVMTGYGGSGTPWAPDFLMLDVRIETSFLSGLLNASGDFVSTDARTLLENLITHELMHAVMGVTTTWGIANPFGDNFPGWFSEGMAQATSGHMNWLPQANFSNLTSGSNASLYATGYAAVMYLGYMAGGNSMASIGDGLNIILGELTSGKSLDQIIRENTKFNGLPDFEARVASDSDAWAFLSALNAASPVGSTGSALADSLSNPSAIGSGNAANAPADFLRLNVNYQRIYNDYDPGYIVRSGGGAMNSGTPIHPSYDPNITRITLPILTAGTVYRIDNNNATVQFSSDKIGNFHYIVQPAGDPPPANAQYVINNGTNGGANTSGVNTINLSALAPGAHSIYIAVEDSNGISNLLQISIPAYVPSTQPPVLSSGSANRTAADAATVSFNSDKPGDIYYIVRNATDNSPLTANDIKTLGTSSGSGGAGQKTIHLTGLATDAQRIYIVTEDANGFSNVMQIGIPVYNTTPPTPPGRTGGIVLQVGANSGIDQCLTLHIENMGAEYIGAPGADGKVIAGQSVWDARINTVENANHALSIIDGATNMVSTQRANLGAMQNRLEHKLNNLGVEEENLTTTESIIRDVDIAKEMMALVKNKIVVQSAQATLAQVNLLPQGVLALIKGLPNFV